MAKCTIYVNLSEFLHVCFFSILPNEFKNVTKAYVVKPSAILLLFMNHNNVLVKRVAYFLASEFFK